MTPRARWALRASAILLALLLGGGAALEIGTRIYFAARGRPLDTESRRAWIASVCEEMASHGEVEDDLAPADHASRPADGVFLEPYLAWQDAATESRMIDDAEAYARADAKAAFDVLLLGGGGAVGLGADGGLAERLRTDPRCKDREVRLHVYAREGSKEPQSLVLLGYLLSLGHEPDLVVEVSGRDDARIGASNAAAGTHPLHPSVEHWSRASRGMRSDWRLVDRIHVLRGLRERARSFGERCLTTGLFRSAFLGHFALGRLAALRGRAENAGRELEAFVRSRPRDAELQGPRFDPEPEAVAATIADGWERAAVLMHALCARRGIAFLQVLEPIPASEEGPIVERLRAAAARLPASGVEVDDASGLLRDLDGGPGGPDRLAASIAEAWSRGPGR